MRISIRNMTGPALLIAGIIIGKNWTKIQKKLKPIANKAMKIVKKKSRQTYKETAKFVAKRKEQIEDMLATPRIKKVEKISSPVEAGATKAVGKQRLSKIGSPAGTNATKVLRKGLLKAAAK